MKSIIQFRITKEDDTYIAEAIDLAIVTQADNLDMLMKNIREAVNLHLENENLKDFDLVENPSILVTYELPQYA